MSTTESTPERDDPYSTMPPWTYWTILPCCVACLVGGPMFFWWHGHEFLAWVALLALFLLVQWSKRIERKWAATAQIIRRGEDA